MKSLHFLTFTLCLFSLIAQAEEPAITDPSYENAKTKLENEYNADKQACDGLIGKQKNVCNTKVEGAYQVKQHELDAMRKGDVNSHIDTAKSKAGADYDVDSAKCAGLKDKSQSLCLEKAKNKLELENADSIRRQKTYDATVEARKKVQDANFDLAMKKCDTLDGKQKLDCQLNAKDTYHH